MAAETADMGAKSSIGAGATSHGVDSAMAPAGGMQKGRITRYRAFPQIDLPDRRWPGRAIASAPTWCSVDLRDGNQALPTPMSVQEKLELFQTLVAIGFKEIEVGFPSSSQIEFDFIRLLIEQDHIPEDVTIQVIVQAREELIRRTFESIAGARRAIVHLYNSTSPRQREVVFRMEKPEIIAIATRATSLIKQEAARLEGTEIIFQYSPESFCLTELDFALEICEAVVDVWAPTPERKIILNIPETVQVATPNVYADQVEWFCRHLRDRASAIVSVHTHNDRGTGVASTELGLLAGAERVEGTLFGNGERTGNVDIVTLALNMYSQGVDPGLDFSAIDALREVYERCTRMEVPPRHPYAGELVFTAFSGSHQDAIKKGMAAQDPAPGALWDVPYLPIDPRDIGRSYEAIIRINSQSGKGGVAYILERELINALADSCGRELSSAEIMRAFEQEYIQAGGALALEAFRSAPSAELEQPEGVECVARLLVDGRPLEVRGSGNGPIDAFVDALARAGVARCEVELYAEHSLRTGSRAEAVAYLQLRTEQGALVFGAAVDTNIELASLKAIVCAINRAERTQAVAVPVGESAST
jgi:2-isopropylmalate synthase